MSYFAPRDKETTLSCPHCGGKLHICRSCHEVFMQCPACKRRYPIKDYIANADGAMEDFLENVYCDRI